MTRPAAPKLTRHVLDLSLGVSSVVASALGGAVGVAIMVATSGAVPWYWGAIGTLYAKTVVKLIELLALSECLRVIRQYPYESG